MQAKAINTPAIVITLGTTSSLAALELCRHLETLEQADRDSVAILKIDTDITSPKMATFLAGNAGKFTLFETTIAVPSGINKSDALLQPQRNHTYIPAKTPQYYDDGAGGIRNNGHVALCYDRDRVEQAISDCLGHVHYMGLGEGERRSAAVQVYFVAFLGGGTGSGIVADLAVLVRNMLTGDQKQQRLVLFSILPGDNMPGVNANRRSWRKSNATAALLEIMAHGLAAQANGGIYTKYLMAQPYDIVSPTIFNEIYLLGRTNLNSVEGTARIVGLDLFHRITDASGIGNIERSESPDRQVLGAFDDCGLPTNFSTSCPFEVRFPADEVAQAFAEVAAAEMLELPEFIGQRPPRPRPGDQERGEWRRKWDQVAATAPGAVDPNGLLIRQPRTFSATDFEQAPQAQRNVFWAQTERSITDTNNEIARVINIIRMREGQRIATVPASVPAVNALTMSLQARKILALDTLLLEYQEALDALRARPPQRPAMGRPADLEAKLDRQFPLPEAFTNPFRQNVAAAVAQRYNGALRANYEYSRFELRKALLEDLITTTQRLLEEEEQWLSQAQVHERAEELRKAGYDRNAWRGLLALPHQHQRHLFDLRIFQEQAQRQNLPFIPAMEGLFRLATTQNEGMELGDCLKRDGFDRAAAMRSLMRECVAAINAVRNDADEAADAGDQDIARERARQVPQKVVAFFRERYLEWFKQHNLFDLLAMGLAAERATTVLAASRQIDEPLRMHLQHIKGILGELITFDPALWLNGSAFLEPTLYLGMNRRDGTQQKDVLARALKSVGEMTRRVQEPRPVDESDIHRLQINYAQHGISLRTVPEFYRDAGSAMGEYLRHQRQWYGDGRSQAKGGSYGRSQMPTHSCGEMERLVRAPNALGYVAEDGRPIDLVSRLLRANVQRDDEPDWQSNSPHDTGPNGGYPNGGYPNGRTQDQPRSPDPQWRQNGYQNGPSGPGWPPNDPNSGPGSL